VSHINWRTTVAHHPTEDIGFERFIDETF
jgi:hypothetical protein